MSHILRFLQQHFPGQSFVLVVRSEGVLCTAGVTEDAADTRQLLSDALQVEDLAVGPADVVGVYDTAS
jgi:hypothetical protein